MSAAEFDKDTLRLLVSAAPEREEETTNLWDSYRPKLLVVDDRPGFTLEVRFDFVVATQRTFDQVWFATCLAFEALKQLGGVASACLDESVVLERDTLFSDESLRTELEALNVLWKKFRELRRAAVPGDFTWPNDRIRMPSGARPEEDKEGMAIHDIVALSLAFCFLHEVRHLRFAADGDAPENPIDEELECDAFARTYLLEKIPQYHQLTEEPEAKVASKRKMGVGMALGTILAMTEDLHVKSKSHPPSPSRLLTLIESDAGDANADCWLTLFCVMLSMVIAWELPFDQLSTNSYRDLCAELVSQLPMPE